MKVFVRRRSVLPVITLILLVGLLGLVAVAGGVSRPAHAATPIVVSTCDESHLDAAIAQANTDNAGDTITFGCSGDIKLTSILVITGSMTLDGSGQMVTLDGNDSVKVLSMRSGVSFTLNTLTIAHGFGDGIGGGLDNRGGTVSISNSTFANNSAGRQISEGGGGLFNAGTMSISNSTFANNSSRFDLGFPGLGGGITNAGTMNISNSTFANNSAGTQGGGLLNYGTVSISNSTFANNSAGTQGGGLDNRGGTVTIGRSIVANNIGGNCQNFGTITSTGYNLESSTDCDFTSAGDLQNTDPKLASSPANNGGPTQTLALRDGSLAINHIPTSACLVTTDQREVSRPQGPMCDIGAFEFRVPALSLPSSPITVDATNPQGAVVTYTVAAGLPDDISSSPTVNCLPTSGSTFPIGTTTVTCMASDAANPPDITTGSFQVVVKDAAAQSSDLINPVNSFQLVPTGIQTSFDSQLQAVQADLAANNTAQACSDLTAFIEHVNAQSGKMLTVAQASQLLAAARQIQAVLGC